MQLSIIIVNWNSKDYLRGCIASVLAETRNVEFEVIVIDSASFDGCGAMLRQDYPQVKFIQSSKNLGFARANNKAFEASKGEFVLFLNPDTELQSPAIDRTYSLMMKLPDAGVLGVRLLNSDGTLQTSCLQAFPTILNQVLNVELLRKITPCSRLWGMAPLFDGKPEPSPVEAISGAFIMIKREVFESVGMFTEDYFMYSEDVDLCHKLSKSGLTNYFVPSATVIHHGGGSSGQTETSTFSSVMMFESRWRFFCRTRSVAYGWIYRISMLAISLLRVLMALPLLLLEKGRGKGVNWQGVLRKWLARLRWALGLEEWVKDCGA